MRTQADLDRVPLLDAVSLLATAVVPQAQRARALIDRRSGSPTYGCADRAYWYYRTLTNFPGATWQQLMLAFACLYRTPHQANPYYRDAHTATLVAALIEFWARSQHSDGSFDEWYRNERSYCPTAITSAGAVLALHLMTEDLASGARRAGFAALERAARWLEPRYNDDVMNQNLAAAVALCGLSRLLPGSRWKAVADAKLERIRRDQTSEGWFLEYSGMDTGYSTLALDMLAACSSLGGFAVADEMAHKLIEAMIATQGAGHSSAGRLGSRGTSHAFPFGALYFAVIDGRAAALAQRWLEGLGRQLVPCPGSVEDRYFAYFYFPQFALAYHRAATTGPAETPVTIAVAERTDYPQSGLAVFRHSGWSVTVSRRLGGAVAVETVEGPPLYHLGYEATTVTGKCYSSAIWEASAAIPPLREEPTILVVGRFCTTSSGIPLRRFMIPFQLVVHVLLTSRMAAAFQSMVKRTMIAPRNTLSLKLERRIAVGEQSVEIQDTLIPEPGMATLSDLRLAEVISMHSPSGRQDRAVEYEINENALLQAIERLNEGAPARLRWVWRVGEAPKMTLEHFEGR